VGGGGGREISTKSVELTHLLAVGSAGAGRPAGTLCVSTARHDDDDGRTSINEQEISRSDWSHTHTHSLTKREEKTNERGARETKRQRKRCRTIVTKQKEECRVRIGVLQFYKRAPHAVYNFFLFFFFLAFVVIRCGRCYCHARQLLTILNKSHGYCHALHLRLAAFNLGLYTLDKGPRRKVQWNWAFLLVKSLKLVPKGL